PMTGSLPDSPQGRFQQALQLESQGRAADALRIYDELLKADPRNVQALAYRGWLLKRAGLPDEAMASLDQAVAIDPSFPDAHFFRGMVLYQDRKDPAAAVTEFRLFMANNPPQEMVPLVEDVLRRAMADAGQPVPPPS
ncbi:MAG: tetratricopeptide repeat protein, partial [Actinomycetota bacterium]|nr:tetratricopeptide repeat protein [Actinomycetota bacterium]